MCPFLAQIHTPTLEFQVKDGRRTRCRRQDGRVICGRRKFLASEITGLNASSFFFSFFSLRKHLCTSYKVNTVHGNTQRSFAYNILGSRIWSSKKQQQKKQTFWSGLSGYSKPTQRRGTIRTQVTIKLEVSFYSLYTDGGRKLDCY